jgi:FkbM family methyltransferase
VGTVGQIQQLVGHVMSHPATEGQRGRAIARLLRRQVANRVFRRKGVVVEVAGTMLRVPAWSTSAGLVLYTGLSEYHPMQFMLRYLRSGDLFVDVGANVGVYSSFACSHGAEVVAFEPFPKALEEVRQNARLNGCTMRAEACAIAERNGTAHFSGFDADGATGKLSDSGLEVPIRTLDSAVAKQPALIKIDVEGAELRVVRGALGTLEAGTVLLVEVHRNLLGGSHKELWEALAQMGYEMVDCERLEPVDAQVGTFVATADVQETRRRVAEKPPLMPPVSVRLL